MKTLTTTLAALSVAGLALVAAPSDADAQFRIGPQGGYNIDFNRAYAGLDMWIGLVGTGENTRLNFSPSVAYYFKRAEIPGGDEADLRIDLDFLLVSETTGFANFYMGPGAFYDPIGDFNRGGLNVNYGVIFMPGKWMNVILQGRTRIDGEFESSATDFGLSFMFTPGNRERDRSDNNNNNNNNE